MYVLNKLGSAVFLADDEFHKKMHIKIPNDKSFKRITKEEYEELLEKESDSHVINVVEDRISNTYLKYVNNYNSKEEYYEAVKNYEVNRTKFIYNYLLKNYSKKYANEFKESVKDNYWIKELGLDVEEIVRDKR